jgi:hypothetical protein
MYLIGLGPQIDKSWRARPDGLLLHETVIWSLFPPHAGMRTGFWHEAYFMAGGIEAIYDDMPSRLGVDRFAPAQPTAGGLLVACRVPASGLPSFWRRYGGVVRRDRGVRLTPSLGVRKGCEWLSSQSRPPIRHGWRDTCLLVVASARGE